jgi:nickel/cobalt transporter (NicO) family protein
VGARGRPVDAVILGVFVTLSHTSGIVLVGVLASLGSAWLVPQVVEAYLALGTGILVIGLGLWMLWTQRELLALAMGESVDGTAPATATGGVGHPHHGHAHGHTHGPGQHHHDHGEGAGWHSHGWGTRHSHRLDLVTDDRRPKLAVLLTLGIVGGILPDPTALAILLASLASGKVLLGLATVVVFSLGFAATLVIVGIVAARVGERVLEWLSSIWVVRVQIATTLLILGMGLVLTVDAAYKVAAALPPA